MQAARVARLLLSAPSASARRASSGRALVARASGRALHGDAVASGGRASDLVPIVYHEDYSMPVLPEGHRFPMMVFGRIYDRLVDMGLATSANVFRPEVCQADLVEKLGLVHSERYVTDFVRGKLNQRELRRIGFPWSEMLVRRTLSEVAGTIFTAELCLDTGVALSCAGGTHHGHRDFGSGFCIWNDLAVTAEVLIRSERVERVLIVDLDVHQGDGTAAIFSPENQPDAAKPPSVFTFSMHCEDNFPARKQRSTLDIGLPKGAGDDIYLPLLAENLVRVLSDYRPDVILYDAGVDVHEVDSLGHLMLTDEGIHRRDRMVMDAAMAHGVPIAGYVGGGYHASLDVLARRHCFLHLAANQVYKDLLGSAEREATEHSPAG